MRTIYHHGLVYSGELPLCQAFAVEDGRFARVGMDEELLALAAEGDAWWTWAAASSAPDSTTRTCIC